MTSVQNSRAYPFSKPSNLRANSRSSITSQYQISSSNAYLFLLQNTSNFQKKISTNVTN